MVAPIVVGSSSERTIALRDVLDPDRLEAGAGAGEGNDRQERLQGREAIEEAIALAEDHRRAQDRRVEPGLLQGRLAARLRAQVAARRVDGDAQSADMDDAAHAGAPAGVAQACRQADMDALELGFAAVQDRGEVDHRVGLAQHAGERRVVMHVARGELDGRQQLQVAGAGDPPGRDADAAAGRARPLDQPLADAAADEAGAAQDQDVEHRRDGLPAQAPASRDSLPAPSPRRQGRFLSAAGAAASAGPMRPPRRERTVVSRAPKSAA